MALPVFVIASLLAGAPGCEPSPSAALPGPLAAMMRGARGLDLLTRGEPARAAECLESAAAGLPNSPEIARDLAMAYLALDRPKEAHRSIERALALGDPDPAAHEIRALILARLGARDAALDATTEAATWTSDLVGAVLDHRRSLHRALTLIDEDTERGALASLVLAGAEGERGEVNAAERLAGLAERQATSVDAFPIVNAARELTHRLRARRSNVLGSARVRTSVDYTTNPGFLTRGRRHRTPALRLALVAEGGVEAPLGNAVVSGALRVDQHFFLTERDELSGLDLTAYSLSAAARYPISRHPSAAVIGVSARFTDVFGDLFDVHYASSIEGGPNLSLRLTAETRVELGFYGIATDFIDVSPPDIRVSSLNRDRVGQRAVGGLFFDTDWLDGKVEAMFLHDDAVGDAFDAIGGAFAGRVRARPSEGVVLTTGVSVTIREYGPVGDLAVIGPAATRTEIRTVVELGARVALADGLDFLIEDVWIDDRARAGHAYTENVISTGVEAWW